MSWDLFCGLGHAMEFLGFPGLLCSNKRNILPGQTPVAAVDGQSPSSFE